MSCPDEEILYMAAMGRARGMQLFDCDVLEEDNRFLIDEDIEDLYSGVKRIVKELDWCIE